jgi:glyceraldehyde 3-phosphate dehydrogenase
MAIKIGMNGFGRIGRYLTRLAAGDPDVEVVAFNARADNASYAHLFKYDSVFGTFDGEVEATEAGIKVNGREIKVTRWARPEEWAWGDEGVDLVVEATGKYTDRASCEKHLAAGAKKVVVSAPAKNPDVTVVYNVNHQDYDPASHNIVSSASCTTNCLAPAAKVLNDTFGIKHGLMTTIHAYTMSQRILDGSHKDLRRARAAAMSMIPTTTGAAKAVTLVMPELEGKLDGMAVRVPTPDASLVDLVCELEKPTTTEEVNAAFKKAANETLGYSEEPLVSVDYIGSTYGGVVDSLTTNVMGGTMCKCIVWYDNEGGFTNQLLRVIKMVGRGL